MRFLGECCKTLSTYLAQFLVTSVCSLFLVEVKLDSFSRKGKHHPQEESATREQEALGCEEELGERASEGACLCTVQLGRR